MASQHVVPAASRSTDAKGQSPFCTVFEYIGVIAPFGAVRHARFPAFAVLGSSNHMLDEVLVPL